MNWQSIETAPKDGTPVLLYSPDAEDPQVFVGRWLDFGDGEPAWYDWWRKDGCWICVSKEVK